MYQRHTTEIVLSALDAQAAVVLLGPRQVGKTTLALEIGEQRPSVYLDLQRDADRQILTEADLYLNEQVGKLVILDEVQQMPDLFKNLRGQIDMRRRKGSRTGQFLLLGSASNVLLHQSAESLAGRVRYIEMPPLLLDEVGNHRLNDLWLRGGFPESLLAESDELSLRWRRDFIRAYLERDIPQFGPRIPAETLRRFWTMLAHHQGGLLNVAQLARNLGVDVKTAGGYLDLLCDLLLVRRLPPWHAYLGKRLVKSPKVYVRDSGIVHALLGIGEKETLLAHPVIGQSWEGFIIENLLNCAGDQAQGYFYRTSGGAEIDLLLAWPDGQLWAVEIKRSLKPQAERGFHSACADLEPQRRFIAYPGTERYRLAENIEAIPVLELAGEVAGYRSQHV